MCSINSLKSMLQVFESLDVVKKAILNLKVGIGSSQSKAVSNALKSHETLSTQFSELLWMQTQENLSDLLKDDSNHKGSCGIQRRSKSLQPTILQEASPRKTSNDLEALLKINPI